MGYPTPEQREQWKGVTPGTPPAGPAGASSANGPRQPGQALMRSAEEVSAMWDQLDNDIREHGWDATVDGAVQALSWVLQHHDGTVLRRAMDRPDASRRREWIARGGDPKDWPTQPDTTEETA